MPMNMYKYVLQLGLMKGSQCITSDEYLKDMMFLKNHCTLYPNVWRILNTRTQLPVLSQFRPPIALRTDLSHITTELWEISVLQMAH